MKREDVKDLTLSILVIVVALLVADSVWLHVKCSREEADIASLAQDLQKTETAVRHLEDWVATSSVEGKLKSYKKKMADYRSSFMDKCRSIKKATVERYEAAKEKLMK